MLMKHYEIRIKISDREIECHKVEAKSEEEAIQKCKLTNPVIYYNGNRRKEGTAESDDKKRF